MRMTQNKNDSINSILPHGRVVHKDCRVIFPNSGFPYLIPRPRQCKWKVATIYSAIRLKYTIKVFEYENLLLLKPPNCKKQHQTLRSLRKSKDNNQKQPFRGVLSKRCSEDMDQIYRRTPMS